MIDVLLFVKGLMKMTENKRFIRKAKTIIDIMTDELVTASSEEGAKILVDKLNSQEKRIKELEREKYRLNSKVKRLTDELANCYEKLGW